MGGVAWEVLRREGSKYGVVGVVVRSLAVKRRSSIRLSDEVAVPPSSVKPVKAWMASLFDCFGGSTAVIISKAAQT